MTRKSDWIETYAREVIPQRKHQPEHPTRRGNEILTRIWNRIRPSLVERGLGDVPESLPKDVSKWAVLPDWCELLEKHPCTVNNAFTWMDGWVPKSGHTFRNGAMTLRRRPDRATARIKQNGQGVNDPTPAFTFHGDRMEYLEVKEKILSMINKAYSDGEYPNEELHQADLESMDKWLSVMGGRCGTYVFAESSILFTGMTPHQETSSPIPWDIFWDSWRKVLEREYPGATAGPILSPKHLFVGIGQTPGIRIQNSEGAAGYPYSNMDREAIQDAIGRPKFTGRPTKGVVFPHALRGLRDWIVAGMPMEGPAYDNVAQPATLAYRGDREVDLNLRKLASKGARQEHHDGALQLAAMFPSRSVIIVPTILVLAESSWGQPLGDYIATNAPPGFDWVDPWHSADRIDQIKRQDLAQSADVPLASVGADASGFDRDVTGQMHAGETARYCALTPEETTLLYVDAPLPIDVDDAWVADLLSSLAEGERRELEVSGLRQDGVPVTVKATAEKLQFNYHEYICKVMSMVNNAPISWGDYEVDAPGEVFFIDGALPRLSGKMVSNGGRRSGDAVTGVGNSDSNLVISDAGATMSQKPELRKLIKRRVELQGEEVGAAFDIEDIFTRGDDIFVLLRLIKGGTPSVNMASSICSVGFRANADKQEASDIPGQPRASFANVFITEEYTGKLAGRTGKRFMVQESPGLDKDTLDIMREEAGDMGLELGLMTTSATARSRLAPLAGFPLLDRHPIARSLTQLAVHNDKYRLAYITPDSVDESGNVTDEGKALLARAKTVEATAMARLRAKRENVSVDLDALKEVYVESTIHELIEEHALEEGYDPKEKMPDTSNIQVFKDEVRAH